jgi:hypothetical protein
MTRCGARALDALTRRGRIAIECAVVTLLILGAAPAGAQSLQLNNSEIPGSVLVFPKFVRGTVQVGTTTGLNPQAIVEPKSAFEISVTCPSNNGGPCAEGSQVKMLARWICPGTQDPSLICQDVDFELRTTVKGTIWFNPENAGSRTPSAIVPRPPCQRGWLVVWVVSPDDASNPRPIKFDGLLGNGVLRNARNAVGAYNAIPIQAVDGVPPNTITDVNGDDRLSFDGRTEYKAVTGELRGTVRFERSSIPAGTNLGRIRTFLTMLTLDTIVNRPNFPTFVDVHFFNENEVLLSSAFQFVCWVESRLSDIDANLDEFFGTVGLVETTDAEKIPIFGVNDVAGPVSLLGLVDTVELNASGAVVRQFSTLLFNDGLPIPTALDPN